MKVIELSLSASDGVIKVSETVRELLSSGEFVLPVGVVVGSLGLVFLDQSFKVG